jgi:hypothetical protein
MKISVLHIVIDHLGTLRNDRTGRVSWLDIFLFYGIPIFGGAVTSLLCVAIPRDVFGLSVSIFSIFCALLLSVQVAVYSIFKSDRPDSDDSISRKSSHKSDLILRSLIREVNTNISYLIVVCCVCITVFLAMYIADLADRLESAVIFMLYSHFLLTVLMVIKRAHAIFETEYRR